MAVHVTSLDDCLLLFMVPNTEYVNSVAVMSLIVAAVQPSELMLVTVTTGLDPEA